MRRLVFIILSAYAWMIAYAANTLSLSAISGHPGETLTVSVSLSNSEAVTAMQASVPLGANLHYVEGSAALNPTRSDGHSLVASAVQDTLHIAIYSLTMTPLKGNNGELLTFKVVLGNEPATYTLTAKAVMSDSDGKPADITISEGALTLLSPKIQVVTGTLDYGHIPIRDTYTQTLQVKNTGNEALHINDVLFSAEEFSVTQKNYTIEAGQMQTIDVSFAPLLHGAISEQVRLRSDAINDPDVYGANECQLIADPFSVNELRMQPASGISDEAVTISARMNNMESIVGAQFSLKLPKALEFVEGSASPLERAKGHSVLSTLSGDTLTLLLYHTQNEAVSGDDGDLLSFRVRLNGISGNYALQPIQTLLVNDKQQNMVSAVYPANVSIKSPKISADATMNFGYVPMGETQEASINVQNKGQVPLTIERVAFLSEGLKILTSLPMQIPVNGAEYIDVELTPQQEGEYATTMQVYSNDPACLMYSVAVTADIYEPNYLQFIGYTKGTKYYLCVNLTNYSDITGLQFDIEGLTPWTSCGLASRAVNHQLAIQPIDENHHRIVIYSLDNTLLTDHEGIVLKWVWDASLIEAINGKTIKMGNAVLVHPSKGTRDVEEAMPIKINYVPNEEPEEPTNIDLVQTSAPSVQKVMIDGQIYILRGDKLYTLTGQEVK